MGALSKEYEEFLDANTWQEIAEAGFPVDAIIKYRDEHGCGLIEARDKIVAHLRRGANSEQ